MGTGSCFVFFEVCQEMRVDSVNRFCLGLGRTSVGLGRIGYVFLEFPVTLLWLSIRFFSRLLLEPFPVACCEIVVAEDASFEAGDNGGPLAEFAGDGVDG